MDSPSVMREDDMSRLFLPPICRGMRVLDRSFFRKTIPISGAIVYNPKKITMIKKACDRDVLKVHGGVVHVKTEKTSPEGRLQVIPITREEKAQISNINESHPEVKRLIPLKPKIKHDDPSTISPALQTFIDSDEVQLVPYELNLEYKDWDYHQIITAILPEELLDEVPSGFTLSGHIAHINLRDAYLPYKNVIGELILDKNKACKTVVNKTDDVGVASEFRTFDMELLAGEPNTEVEVSESGCRFQFDFAKVYWNSRLSNEHQRIFGTFKPGEAVADVMAGVGPFAVPAGKKRVFVWANDLNPESYKAMVTNIKLNKVEDFVKAFNEDGRNFVRQSVLDLYRLSQSESRRVLVYPKVKASRSNPIFTEQQLSLPPPAEERPPLPPPPPPEAYFVPPTFGHFVMNLPASAVEFLDAFTGLYTGMEKLFEPYTTTKLPMIHLHIFDKQEQSEAYGSICERISKYLNYTITLENVEFTDVRLVAPKKMMYCATFRLPADVAFAGHEARGDSGLNFTPFDVKAWLS